MSKKWRTSADQGAGRYGLTNGVYKRLWGFYMPLSTIIIPLPPKRNSEPAPEPNYILTELGSVIKTEADQGLIVE